MSSEDQILIDLGNRLKGMRDSARLTQADVAGAAKINVSYYAEIERGEVNPSYKILRVILIALNQKSLDI